MNLTSWTARINIPLLPTFPKPTKIEDVSFWDKIKYINSSSDKKSNSVSDSSQLLKFGTNGEIFMASDTAIQVWDWVRSAIQTRELETVSHKLPLDTKNSERLRDDTLQLHLVASSSEVIDRTKAKIVDYHPIEIKQDRNYYKMLVVTQNISTREITLIISEFGQLFPSEINSNGRNQILVIPPGSGNEPPYTIATSERFACVSSYGNLTIFDIEGRNPLKLELHSQSKNNTPLFDMTANKLIYISENSTGTPSFGTLELIVSQDAATISQTFLDNIESMSVKSIARALRLRNSKSSEIKASLLKMIRDSSQNFIRKGQIENEDSMQTLHFIDLDSGLSLGAFKPFNGVSKISICPYNPFHMVTVSKSGDMIYKWDLTNAPKKIVLLHFEMTRLNDSIVSEIAWSSMNNIQLLFKSPEVIMNINFLDSNTNWLLQTSFSQILPIYPCSDKSFLMAAHGSVVDLIDLTTGVISSQFKIPELLPKMLLPSYIPLKPMEEIIVRETMSVIGQSKSKESKLSRLEYHSFNKAPIFPGEVQIIAEPGTPQRSETSFWSEYYKSSDYLHRSEEVLSNTGVSVEILAEASISYELDTAMKT
ncbi:hypothetical protein WICPIJ_004835 [Wickerhamomyces pijperi]|uniref:Uncharacterized protein n=1 Tax=Wickerhamomyces pijperi TaxID=599730 RepID=A0A9P8Q6X3_WICPI|nr:hypothetical protein WICPIJ_004835 [Wickerhamomyces pijperi]